MYTNKEKNKRFFDIGLKKLEEKKLDTLGNIAVIAKHQKPLALSYALCELHKHNLLTAENRDTLKEYSQPQDITNALLAITSVKLATQENLNTLFTLKNLEFLENAGYLLYRIPENKLSQTVFDKIMELSQQQEPIRQISQYINQLLTEANPINNNSKTHSTLFQSLTPSDSRITNDHSQNNLTR
jgi:hypothetical protein